MGIVQESWREGSKKNIQHTSPSPSGRRVRDEGEHIQQTEQLWTLFPHAERAFGARFVDCYCFPSPLSPLPWGEGECLVFVFFKNPSNTVRRWRGKELRSVSPYFPKKKFKTNTICNAPYAAPNILDLAEAISIPSQMFELYVSPFDDFKDRSS